MQARSESIRMSRKLTSLPKPLHIRSWVCDGCGVRHDRDIKAAQNIRNEAQRMIIAAGTVATASRGTVSQSSGRKTSVMRALLKLEAPSFTAE